MKIAIIGSRSINIENLEEYLPNNVTEIVSGGARGVDKSAEKFAKQNKLKLTLFLPEYDKYGIAAPIKRNLQIIKYADKVLAFWDGKSKGTENVIKTCQKIKKDITVIIV